jgi:hypothetical protein
MSLDIARLPPGFDALEPFVDDWAIAGSANRADRRCDSSEAERIAFYEVATGLAPAALELLDRRPLEDFDEREKRLMNLMLMLAHVSLAVEAQGSEEPNHARDRRHLKITRSPADPHA